MATQQDINININSKLNDKGFNDLNKSIAKVGESTKSLSNGFGNLQAALVGGLAGGFATVVAQMIPFTINAIKVGASLNNLRAGFAGTAKDMELLRKATAGTVSEAGLIALSNQATDLGLNLQDQAKLFSLAEDAGDKYGGSLEENFQKIVNATDGSARGLRAVGISTKEYEQKVNELVKTTGKKLEQMSAEEQLQIRLKAIFELTGTTLDSINKKTVDSADVLEQLGIAAEEVAAVFGSSLVTSFSKSGIAAKGLASEMNSLKSIAKLTGDVVGEILAGLSSEILDMVQQDMKDIEKLITWYNTWKPAFLPGIDNPFEAETNQRQAQKMGGDFIFGKMPTLDTDKLLTFFPEVDTNKDKTTKSGSSSQQKKEVEEAKKTVSSDLLKVSLESLQDAIYNRNLSGITAEAVGRGGMLFDEQKSFLSVDTEGALKDEREKAIEDGKTIYNNVTNIMNLLGVSADSFVGTLISGFNTVLAIMESIEAVNSILGFIPGLATGGSVTAGMPYIVGEKGAELFMPNSNGQIFSHEKTMKILSQSNNMNAPAVNIYVGGTLDGQTFLKNNFPKYQSMKNYKRIN